VGTLIVPTLDEKPWPTLGPQIADFLEERSIYGPGSLKGEPYVLDPQFRALLYRMYEVYPQGHPFAGRRRFKRAGISVRKGLAKTEQMAQIAFVELHPEAPVRCDGFDAKGRPVGRPVRDPYIPLLAVNRDQVEELAYGCLFVLCTEGPDADYFDAAIERIIRIGDNGRADGKAVPLSNSPGPRDGARTTFQGFDEPHRLFLPRQLQAHETMMANLEKRVLEDPWALYVGTAGEPGQGSIAEGVHAEAQQIAEGTIKDPQLIYFHREAGPGFDMNTLEGRTAAVADATGPIGEFGPGQFQSIAKQWDRPAADKKYLERVWLNRWTRSDEQAFDVKRWEQLATPEPIPFGAFVAAGFDGARFRDSTGIVITDIETGRQQLWATWERPVDADEWEIPEEEVTAAWGELQSRFILWNCYGDPPHWTETFGSWAARWPDKFTEWWTANTAKMARAVRAYKEGIESGAVTHVSRPGNPLDLALDRHIAAAGRKDTNHWEDDRRLFVLRKIHEDRKFDNAMAACLSWTAYLDAVKSGATPPPADFIPYRIR
jgi:hypothetical protein